MHHGPVLVATVAAAVTCLGAAPVHASGQVERGPEHAKPICSFSGLNDEPDAPGAEGGRVQSYGQLVRLGELVPKEKGFERPGVLCNPNNLPLK